MRARTCPFCFPSEECNKIPIEKYNSLKIVAQTTFDTKEWKKSVKKLKKVKDWKKI